MLAPPPTTGNPGSDPAPPPHISPPPSPDIRSDLTPRALAPGLRPLRTFGGYQWRRIQTCYRPQQRWGKVMFLHVSMILFTGGWYPSIHCRWYPSMPCSRSLGGGIPACLARFQAHTQGGVKGSGRGGFQVHTWGVSRPTPRGVCIPACTEADPLQRLLLRAVCILLECILVHLIISLSDIWWLNLPKDH